MAFNTYINNRLNQWALWSAQRLSGGLGFPSECSYTRLTARSSNGFRSPNFDEDAWLIEQAVLALPDYLRETVIAVYIKTGTTEQKAKDLRCHRDTIYARLDLAHSKIMDWLNDEACGVLERTKVNVENKLSAIA
jgi:hypothetical protein